MKRLLALESGSTLMACLAMALALFASIAAAQGGPPPAKVVLDAARVEVVEVEREVTAELRALRRSLVAAEESGQVIESTVHPGESVEIGQVMARLDTKLAELAMTRAQAAIAAAGTLLEQSRAELEKADRDLERAKNLISRSVMTESQVQDAETVSRTSRARVAQREAEQELAEVELARAREIVSRMQIVAPFSGIVVTRFVEVGEWVIPGNPVVEIVDLAQLEVWLDIPESVLARVDPADDKKVTVQLRVNTLSEEFAAEIVAIVPAGDRLSRLFPARALVENSSGRLRPGMSVVGLIPTGASEPTLTVAKDAILRDDAGEYLYFDGGGVAQVARVSTLFAVGDRVAVRAPRLADQTPVVIEGNERIFPGQPLIVVSASGN